jgi:16S rRNA (guanine966-N2)-methyltransferase
VETGKREDVEVKGFVIDTVRDIGKARITLLRLETEPA